MSDCPKCGGTGIVECENEECFAEMQANTVLPLAGVLHDCDHCGGTGDEATEPLFEGGVA